MQIPRSRKWSLIPLLFEQDLSLRTHFRKNSIRNGKMVSLQQRKKPARHHHNQMFKVNITSGTSHQHHIPPGDVMRMVYHLCGILP